MPKKKVRVAVVGIGGIAQITHVPALKRIPGAEIAALCDRDEEKAGRVAQRLGVKQVTGGIDELLTDESIDAFVVCTPNYLHAPISIAALEAGKHVLCERPMARNAEEAGKMVAAAANSDRILMCAMNHRFRADSQILKKFVVQGELGSVFFGKAGWLREQKEWAPKERRERMKLSGGGVLMDLGVQMLDLALWILGAPAVESVTASAHRRQQDEVEDAMSAFLRLQGGGALTLEVSWGLLMEKDFAYCNLFGENGAALWNPLRIHKAMHGSLVNVTPEMDSPRNVYKQSIENELGHFLESVRTGDMPMASGEEMVSLMRLVDAIYRSADEGREVKLV